MLLWTRLEGPGKVLPAGNEEGEGVVPGGTASVDCNTEGGEDLLVDRLPLGQIAVTVLASEILDECGMEALELDNKEVEAATPRVEMGGGPRCEVDLEGLNERGELLPQSIDCFGGGRAVRVAGDELVERFTAVDVISRVLDSLPEGFDGNGDASLVHRHRVDWVVGGGVAGVEQWGDEEKWRGGDPGGEGARQWGRRVNWRSRYVVDER